MLTKEQEDARTRDRGEVTPSNFANFTYPDGSELLAIATGEDWDPTGGATPTQNATEQPRDEAGKWIASAVVGDVTHSEIDAAGLPKNIAARAHEALGRHERGEEIARVARESPVAPDMTGLTPVQLNPLPARSKAREASAETLPQGSHADVLRELHERAGQMQTTYDQIEEHVGSLAKLSKEKVAELASGFGISGQDSKAGYLRRIEKRLTDRLGHAERGAQIEAEARKS